MVSLPSPSLVRRNLQLPGTEALVVANVDADILAGVPFMTHNITVCPAKRQIILSDNTVYCYGPETHADGPHIIHLTKAVFLRAPTTTTTLWPGTFWKLTLLLMLIRLKTLC